jgi:hypothetical protein
MFNAPFTTRDPQPHVLAAAAESVTGEFNDRMFTSPFTVPGRPYNVIHASGRRRTSNEK